MRHEQSARVWRSGAGDRNLTLGQRAPAASAGHKSVTHGHARHQPFVRCASHRARTVFDVRALFVNRGLFFYYFILFKEINFIFLCCGYFYFSRRYEYDDCIFVTVWGKEKQSNRLKELESLCVCLCACMCVWGNVLFISDLLKFFLTGQLLNQVWISI